jgi:predicted nucleic acid-binding protein
LRVALDTNVLAYAEGVNGADRRGPALDLIERLAPDETVIPVQVLGELFSVLTRKAGKSRADARDAILSWRDTFPLIETSPAIMLAAADLASDHQFGIWDAVILSAAAHADCRLLLSEDLQDGFTWGGVTIVNPFGAPRNPLLNAFGSDKPERSRR